MTAPVAETTTPATAAAPAAAAVEEVIDLQPFKDATENSISDPSNGAADEDVTALKTAYAALGRKGKAQARAHLEGELKQVILAKDFATAAVIYGLLDAIKTTSGKGDGSTRVTKTHTEKTVFAVAAIQVAYSLAMGRGQADTKLDSGWEEKIPEFANGESQAQAKAYAAWLENKQEGEEPKASDVAKAAARIALGKAPHGSGRKPKAVEEAALAAAEATGSEDAGSGE